MFKSPTQPLCRYCGKAIRKWTKTVYFGHDTPRDDGHTATRIETPRDKAEVERLVNGRVTSVRRAGPYWAEQVGHDYVASAGVWDGESYHDDLFCTVSCGEGLGRLMAKEGRCTTAYNAALARQKEKSKMMTWEALDEHCTVEHLGFLPGFISEDNPKPAREQIDDNYRHGGGWNAFRGHTFNPETYAISYPGDPPLRPLARTRLRDEVIYFYPYAWVLILQADGSYEIARVD